MSHKEFDNEIQSNTETSYTNIIGDIVKSIVPKLKSGLDPLLYKSRRICKICGLNIKDSRINSKNKRYNCKFCHDAVCVNCSNMKCYHTAKGGLQRICHGCFAEAIESKIREEYKEEIEKFCTISLEEKKHNISELNRIEPLLQKIKDIANNKKKELLNYNTEIEQLMINLKENNEEFIVGDDDDLKNLEKSLLGLNSELDVIKNKLLIKDQEINIINNEIVKYDLQISDLIAEREYTKNSKVT